MSTSELAPPSPPLSPAPSPRRNAASSPLPELPSCFHATKSYHSRSICTCNTPQEKTYFQPLIICRARAQQCPTRYYHAHCVGEVPRHPLDTTPWYCAHCMSEDVVPTRVCTCGDDSQDASALIVQCSRRAACAIRWYHRPCAGSPEEEKWVCEACLKEDGEDGVENEQQQQKEKRQQAQKQPQKHPQQQSQKTQQHKPSKQFQQSQPAQQKRQRRQHQNEPEDDEDSEPLVNRLKQTRQKRQKRQNQHQHHQEQEDKEDEETPTRRVKETRQKQQKQQQPKDGENSKLPSKQQHQDEPKDNEDAAPPAKRVRFSPNRLSEEPASPAERRAEVSPERSESNAKDPEEQSSDGGCREQSPDESEYCFCGQPSSMEMVACDGKKCEREWFHFECVGVTEETVPGGKWYCDECSVKETKRAKEKKGARGVKKRKR